MTLVEHRDRTRSARATAYLAPLLSLACGNSTGPVGSTCEAIAGQGGGALSLSLSPGETCTLVSADAEAVEIAPATGSAQYLVVVQSGSSIPGAQTSLRFEARAGVAAASRVSTIVAPTPARSHARMALEEASRAELRLRANQRRALADATPLRARPTRTASPGEHVTASIAAARPPAVGDTIVFHNTVDADLDVDCAGIHDVTAVVQAVGQSYAIVEDIEAAGTVSSAQYRQVLQTLETSVRPVISTYFGDPADLDANDVVFVLFTPVVNRTTPRGSTTRVSGFFNPSDLADPASCAGSNHGEILYVLAADPGGRFSSPVPATFATSRSIAVAAHELEHLISAERRVIPSGGSFADLEDAWLGEGLAHSAETVVGMSLGGLRPGQNYGFSTLSAEPATFDTYYFPNFRRAGYYLADVHRTMALGDADGDDPGGVSSLEMRGFGWLLLRWLADQYAGGGGGLLGGPAEEGLFHDLTGGGSTRTRGVANLERVAAAAGAPVDWEDILTAYALSPLADDLGGQTGASTQITSFQLRDSFAALNQRFGDEEPFGAVFPLVRTNIPLSEVTSVGVEFDLAAATGRYFVLESGGPHPVIRMALTTLSGGSVPASARAHLVVLRTR